MSTEPSTEDNKNDEEEFRVELLPEDYAQYDLSFKIIVIGDSGVGKSCFTNKSTKNIFITNYNATIGFEFFNFNIKLQDKIIKLQIWDTCGQELYRSLITNFYRNSSLAIVVYAVNSLESFEDLDMWFRELRIHSNPDIKIVLVGNKTDLVDERVVTTKQGEDFAKLNKVNRFIEASAKEGINTQSTFVDIAKLLFEEHVRYRDIDKTSQSDKGSRCDNNESVELHSKLELPSQKIKQKQKCC